MHTIPASTIAKYFEKLDDPRMDRTKLHVLSDILVIAICAIICDADGWVDVENYGTSKYAWLTTFLVLPHGIPSPDTFGRVFAHIDPIQFQHCFMRWMRAIYQVTHGAVVPIDGKTLRHSFDTAMGLSPIHMVSAWATHNRLVLGQVKVADKSNEITAIPELLKTLDSTGCIITIDAMGCQTAIARQIIEQQADYVLALKANQGMLYADVQLLIDGMIAQNDAALAYYEMHDENHGRFEIRRYWTTSTLDTLRTRHAWHKLQTVGVTEAERTRNGETTIERRYYI